MSNRVARILLVLSLFAVILAACSTTITLPTEADSTTETAQVDPTEAPAETPAEEQAGAAAEQREETEPRIPEDKMTLIAGNRTYANLPVSLTIAGGEYGDGQTFVLNAGEEVRLELAPGDYQMNWVGDDNRNIGRNFRAEAGGVVITWMVPEDDVVFAIQPKHLPSDLGQVSRPAATSHETPYFVPEEKALLVAGNMSVAGTPSTLTLSGGQFGEAEQAFIVNPRQETLIALEPGEYQAIWTTTLDDADSPHGKERTFIVEAGQIEFGWIHPEQGQAIFQRPGQPGEEAR